MAKRMKARIMVVGMTVALFLLVNVAVAFADRPPLPPFPLTP